MGRRRAGDAPERSPHSDKYNNQRAGGHSVSEVLVEAASSVAAVVAVPPPPPAPIPPLSVDSRVPAAAPSRGVPLSVHTRLP